MQIADLFIQMKNVNLWFVFSSVFWIFFKKYRKADQLNGFKRSIFKTETTASESLRMNAEMDMSNLFVSSSFTIEK